MTRSILLAGTALLALTVAISPTRAMSDSMQMMLAQASPPPPEGDNEKKNEHRPQQKPGEKAAPPQHQVQQPRPPEHKPAEKPAAQRAPEAAQPAEPKGVERPQERRDERRQERHQENGGKPEQQPAPAAKPQATTPANRPATEPKPPQQPTVQQHNEIRPPVQKPPEQQPAATQAKPPASTSQPPAAQAPASQKPAAQTAPTAQPPANNAQTNAPANRNAQTAAPAAVAPPQRPQSAQQFILQKNAKPTATIQDLRKERHETREGNRTVITEGNRTIVTQDNRTIIRHSEAQRFAVGARDVNVQRQGNETTTVIVRPDGDRIINVTDERGNLIRRVRRDRNGREVVIIDERSLGPRDIFIDLPPPVIHIPRDRYIVEVDRARPETIYEVLDAPPVERIEQRYTIDQVRYSAPLRERMPRLDLDINFDTGSWQLTPDQIDKLSVVAEGLNRAIDRNPREVFLIEGHTDAVGSAEDNLSLSDRRAEAAAVALTEQFHVPPENLVTQGYGEQDLKVQTQEASRANRRVSVRRITPLIDRQAAQ